MKKRFSSLAVFVAIGFCATTAYAQEYQAEISADYVRADYYDLDTRTTMIDASAEVFFDPVKTAEHPYAEAAFVERIGSFKVMATDVGMKSSLFNGDGRIFLAAVNYAKPDFPLAIQAKLLNGKVELNSPLGFTATSKNNGYSISVGNYFTHTLLAGLNYDSRKYESSGSPFLAKDQEYGFFAHYVNELEHGNALSLDGGLSCGAYDDGFQNLKNTIEKFTANYFFNRGLSAGFGFENNAGTNLSNEGRNYSANIRYFISSHYSVNAMYFRSLKANAGNSDERTFQIGMALRF